MQIPFSCLDFCRYVFVFVNVMLTLQEGPRGGWAPPNVPERGRGGAEPPQNFEKIFQKVVPKPIKTAHFDGKFQDFSKKLPFCA